MTESDKKFIDMLVARFRKDNITGWSMCDILDIVMATGASVTEAREYLLKEVFGIEDEQKFIKQRIAQAKRRMINIELMDKPVKLDKVMG